MSEEGIRPSSLLPIHSSGNYNKEIVMDEIVIPDEQVIRGLKAKLMYFTEDCNCTPIDKCACEQMLEDVEAADEWVRNLPGEETQCDG